MISYDIVFSHTHIYTYHAYTGVCVYNNPPIINPVGFLFIIRWYSVIGYPNKNLDYPNKKNVFFSISKLVKFQHIAQLKYCQTVDFEGYPNNNLNYP